jgi:hypothetical protein
MHVYLAGPMTGYPDYNRPAFHAAQRWLEARGHSVINPAHHDITDGTWEQYLALALHVIHAGQPDAIVMLPGWQASRGARLERASIAGIMAKPAYSLISNGHPGEYWMVEQDNNGGVRA